MSSLITIGTDPEFFLQHKKSGAYVSAHDLVPGTKYEPHKVEHGAIQADGTAVEININPVTNAKDFRRNLNSVLKEVRGMVDPSLEFVFKPAIFYPQKYFDSLPDHAKELGCEPDRSSKTGKFKQLNEVRLYQGKVMRTGAGHIHIGWGSDIDIDDPNHLDDCQALCAYLDSNLMPIMRKFSPPNERLKLYGADGAYRVKPYGVEFRAPDNGWLAHKKLYTFVFTLFQKATEYAMKGDGGALSMFRMDLMDDIHYGKQSYTEEYKRSYKDIADSLNFQTVMEAVNAAKI